MRAQQLVEQRAVGVSIGRGARARCGDGEEFDAVADPHCSTRPPLAAMMTATWVSACCSLCNPTPPCLHSAASAAKAAGSRVRAISVARLCRAGANRSSQSRPGRITSAQISTSSPGLRCGSGFAPGRLPTDRRQSGLILGAAGPPPLLPAVTGLGSQPVHHGQHPQPPGLLTDRRCPTRTAPPAPVEDRGPARLGLRPRRGGRRGGNAESQLRPGPVRRPGHRGHGIGGSRRQQLRVDGGHDSPRRTGSAGSPRGIPPPAARPGRGRVAGHGKPARPAITSSVTGFR